MHPERRRAERIATATIAYIHLAPDNGGIILNISEDGLAFHSAAPVEQGNAVQFWMSLRANERIEGTGDLMWTDGAGKSGGLRLTALSAEAREQIRSWMQADGATSRNSESPTAPGTTGSREAHDASLELAAAAIASFVPEAAVPLLPESAVPIPEATANQGLPSAAERSPVTEPVPPNPSAGKNKVAAPATPKIAAAPQPRSSQHSSWTLGLLVAAIALAAVVGIHFRGQLGSFLIYIGDQLAHTSKSKNDTSPAPSAVAPATARIFPALSTADRQELSDEIAEFDRENRAEEARQEQVRARGLKTSPRGRGLASFAAARQFAKPHTNTGSSDFKSAAARSPNSRDSSFSKPSLGRPLLNNTPGSARSNTLFRSSEEIASNNATDAGGLNFQDQAADEGEGAIADGANRFPAQDDAQEPLYLDVGNSKDVSWADETATTLAKMGFNATVDHKGHLWMSSYHVLVGPFTTDDSLDKVSDQLKARGFTTHYAKR